MLFIYFFFNLFRFFIIFSGKDVGRILASGYLLVDPELTIGLNDKIPLPLDCIQCQTVLAKLLGPFSTWEEKLKVSYKSGYNMIHFTPIQVKILILNRFFSYLDNRNILIYIFNLFICFFFFLQKAIGGSKSAYSLSDQLKLNPTFHDTNKKTTFDDIEKFTKKMREEWNVRTKLDKRI